MWYMRRLGVLCMVRENVRMDKININRVVRQPKLE